MQIATPMKLGLVTAFSCLTLLVSMFFTTGTAAAYSANTLQSQASSSTAADARGPSQCRTYTIVNERFSGYADQDTGAYISNGNINIFQGQRGVFVTVGHKREFHRVSFVSFEKITIVTICNGHRSERTVIQRI